MACAVFIMAVSVLPRAFAALPSSSPLVVSQTAAQDTSAQQMRQPLTSSMPACPQQWVNLLQTNIRSVPNIQSQVGAKVRKKRSARPRQRKCPARRSHAHLPPAATRHSTRLFGFPYPCVPQIYALHAVAVYNAVKVGRPELGMFTLLPQLSKGAPAPSWLHSFWHSPPCSAG